MKTAHPLAIICFTLLSAPFISHSQCGNGILQPPCNPTIPPDAEVITGYQTRTGNVDCFWVCSGDSLFMTGVNSQIYAEQNAYVRIMGGENFVWLHDQGTCVVDSGSSMNWIRRKLTTTLLDYGNLTWDTVCSSLAFNYTSAPQSGCSPTGIWSIGQTSAVRIYPNPTSDYFYIEFWDSQSATVEIYDSAGKLVLYDEPVSSPTLLDIRQLSQGVYSIMIGDEVTPTVIQRLMIE